MTTAIAIEDVRREVKILRALTGHNNLVQFYDAYEDHDNVYIVMELCEGGELLDRILSRGGKYTEDDAKAVMIQILNVVAFCHLQGVVHRDLKPENFLFMSKDENSQLKAIDFGLSDFVKPDERLNDIVGSAYYVAPEVLHRSYTTEADVWSIGVIAYILLCGSRPFWARTESGIFRAVLKADPSFEEPPWPSLSAEAKDFVKRLLNKDPRKRMTAAQALSHPWIKNSNDAKVPLDILIFKLMKAYMRSSSLRKAALKALSKTLTVDELFYLREQYALLEPNKSGTISLENVKVALMKYATDAMKESRVPDFLVSLNALQYRRMDFEEFCAAALSVHQLEALDRWEQHARCAYELFEKDGNRAIVIEELASELGLSPSVPVHAVLHDWVRHTDGKLSFLGFVKLLHDGGDLESLTLKDCKSYLRKHGLRLAGTKAVCIQRIKEHWRIKDGSGEAFYPRSTFVNNCTGDVCKGDVVLFTQKVYERFNKVTRHGTSHGKRTVAGRVVKESYGAAKQQHTFTVEVLWSKGSNRLPPLFPLLVKGRNLYRLRTFRQRWSNESGRVKVLAEKHKRGTAARLVRAMKNTKKTQSTNGGVKHQKQFHHTRPSQSRKPLAPEKGKHFDRHGKATFQGHAKFRNHNQRQEAPPMRQVNIKGNAISGASEPSRKRQKFAHHNDDRVPTFQSYVDPSQFANLK
ncbi:hypothetical protein FH972_003994 [Carpinus fangiana]|uniref:Protein kinase domain-containing protein n=1 Tax=Carpinus fangiana TaxID=176857 RepID=A0A5N6QNC0_9ROSI|nr:hypothetical protein FH972_003994 [Carpinus fangiana]